MTRLDRIEAAHVDSLTFVPFLTNSEVDPVFDALAAIPGLLAIARAAAKIVAHGCGEWLDHPERGPHRCGAPAEYVLWGKLIDKDGLGPRCYDHAMSHCGARMLRAEGAAIIDLGPTLRALADFEAEA